MWNIGYEWICVWWRTKKESTSSDQLHAVHERRDQRAFSSGAVYWATTKKKFFYKVKNFIQYYKWGGNSTAAAAAWERRRRTGQSSIQFSTSFLFDLSHFLFCIYNHLLLHFVALNIIVFSSLITIFHIYISTRLSHSLSLLNCSF